MKTNQTDKLLNKIDIEKWRNYYAELLTENRPEFQSAEKEDNLAGTLTISEREVHLSLKKMKTGRSPGPGNIAVELLKCGTEKLRWRLAELFNQCCLQNKLPQEWRVAYIVSLEWLI
ncbi:uncharacterized protein LOC115878924 [Sitophilus oryzae]|uniref:Uncharacterized protein LOC115878924 n=1 Tax=Sitophilus oryzae TaxID=7048 RepID=A0A6J2XL48_SITOR|nr:uncharacterized protein LOC115878924 [Sitophilus oryzae]